MSSIRLKKEYDGNKAGSVVSVSFIQGRELIAKGIGEYASTPPAPIVQPKPPDSVPVVEAPAPVEVKAETKPDTKPVKK